MQITWTQKEFVKVMKKKIGEYHDLYIQNCTLLLAEVFENFRNICLKICKLDFAKFISAPGLA